MIETESSFSDHHYCGVCKFTYPVADTLLVTGFTRIVYFQDDTDIQKDTIDVLFIQCPERHTVGVRDGIQIEEDDHPF